MLKKVLHFFYNNPLISLVSIALLIRAIILILYTGYSIFPDSSGYIKLAQLLTSLDLSNYTGERTPGYPTIIALTGNNLNLTILFQSFIGVINTILVYKLILNETKHIKIAFCSTFLFTSFINLLFYEVAILTETTALTILLASFWYIKTKELLNKDSSIKHFMFLSILFAYAYLVRPMFIFIPIGFSLFFIVKNIRHDYKKAFTKAFCVLIFPAITFYSWSALNEKNIGVFGSTYFLGINLAQTATSFFEKAPNEEALIRDIFIKHRDSIVTYGKTREYPMSVWMAYDELLEKTQLSPPELSNKLGDISINLFKKHPDLYLKQVGISWINFWKDSILWKPQQLKSTLMKNIFMGTWLYIQRWLVILINIAFLFFSLKKIILFFKSKCQSFDFNLLIVLIVISGSLAQALVAYGSNSRFSFPFLPLIIYIVAINLTPYLKNHVANSST